MSDKNDKLSEIMYGKTETVELADGKKYKMSELDLDSWNELNIATEAMGDVKNVFKIAYMMIKQNHPDLEESKFNKLVLVPRMIQNEHPFMKSYLALMGISGDSKNDLAGSK